MKKYFSLLFNSLFLFSSMLVSCDKEPSDIVEEYPWYLGYFKGAVNDTTVSIENTSEKHIIKSGVYINSSSGQEHYNWVTPINDNCYLTLYIVPLKEMIQHISNGYFVEDDESAWTSIAKITKIVNTNNASSDIVYYPSKQPVTVTIENVHFGKGSGMPYVKGKIDGIFYNINNPTDSITISNALFGIH